MSFEKLDAHVHGLPRAQIGFYPTPFHKLENLSRDSGVNIFMKREDMAGPGTISGSKLRLAEFIIGQALSDGVTHVLTQGAYLTNSGMQFAMAAVAAGLKPILFLQDESHRGPQPEYRGNLLLNQIMGVEVHLIPAAKGEHWDTPSARKKLADSIEAKYAALVREGHRPMIVPGGGAHPTGLIAHALTFKEMTEQSNAQGVMLDYIYHTAGTGTALPGLIAAKLLSGSKTKIRSITINHYAPGNWINSDIIINRAKGLLGQLGIEDISEAQIESEIDLDQRFIGEDYAMPSPESVEATRELARRDAVFVGPVYTAKGFAGLLDHIRSGRVPAGSNVAFLHTGDTGNLFEIPSVVGDVTADPH